MQNRVTIYIKTGCHLCEQMVAELAACQPRFNLEIDTVAIEDSEALLERYGHKVPVLVKDEQEICHYFLDQEALENALNETMADRQ